MMADQRLGTAEWADPVGFAKQHPFQEGLFWVGRSPVGGQALGLDDDRHVCLVSGSRSGKGTTTIVPNLCLWPGSLVVIDPKGENATVTAARRGAGSAYCVGRGQKVFVLDPFRAATVEDRYRARFNPLDVLDPARPDVITEAGRIADSIVVPNPQSTDPSWDEGARSMIRGLILHVITSPAYEDRRHLGTVRDLLAQGDVEGVELLRGMGEAEIPSSQELLWATVARNTALAGIIAGVGQRFSGMLRRAPKQFEGMNSNAINSTEFLDDPAMRESLSASDFLPSELKTDPKGISVYLSLPQRFMATHYRWLRMIITIITTEMEAVKQQPACGRRVLLCLDEFAGLKRMEVIESAVAQIAGYGVKMFFVLQSLEQLKGTYQDKWETFLTNCSLKLFFGVGDNFTREYVSKQIGETQLVLSTHSKSQAINENRSVTAGRNDSTSVNDSLAVGESNSTGTSESSQQGRSESDSFRRMPLFLRDTAGLVRHLTGAASASNSNSSSQSMSTSSSNGTSVTATRGTSYTAGTSSSQSWSTGQTVTAGENETIHKRPLIAPDEVGTYFARIDDAANPMCPGLCLLLMGEGRPAIVRKVHYFTDPHFETLFDPHPDHPATSPLPLKRLVPLMSPFTHRSIYSFMGFGAGGKGSRSPALKRWLKTVGEPVARGEAIAELTVPVRGDPTFTQLDTLVLYASVSGTLHSCLLKEGEGFHAEREIASIMHDAAAARVTPPVNVRDEVQEYLDGTHPIVAQRAADALLGAALVATYKQKLDQEKQKLAEIQASNAKLEKDIEAKKKQLRRACCVSGAIAVLGTVVVVAGVSMGKPLALGVLPAAVLGAWWLFREARELRRISKRI